MPTSHRQRLPIGVCVCASVEQNKKLNKTTALREWGAEGGLMIDRRGRYECMELAVKW